MATQKEHDDALRQLYALAASGLIPPVVWAGAAKTIPGYDVEKAQLAESQMYDHQGFPMDTLLPCDVKLPPATTITKGCKLATFLLSLEQRRKMPKEMVKFARSPRAVGVHDRIDP